jgi:hypothetical protein
MKHVGFHSYRLRDKKTNALEIKFSREWRKVNTRNIFNVPYLTMLVPNLTKRDEQVAATIIQWLGSPVGQGFVQKVMGGDK